MTIHRFLLAAVMLAVMSCSDWTHRNNSCEYLSIGSTSIKLTECTVEGGVTVAAYAEIHRLSPYATEFDQRKVTVAHSLNETTLLQFSGFSLPSSRPVLNKTVLAQVPLEDQISKRHVVEKISVHHRWVVVFEEIEYFNPKDPGFPLVCATALTHIEQTHISAGECFELGQTQRFFDLLDGMRLTQ